MITLYLEDPAEMFYIVFCLINQHLILQEVWQRNCLSFLFFPDADFKIKSSDDVYISRMKEFQPPKISK